MSRSRLIFRIITGIPAWLFLQSAGTLAFTLFGIFPLIGFVTGVGNFIMFLGTGNREFYYESLECFEMLITIFGGTLTTYS